MLNVLRSLFVSAADMQILSVFPDFHIPLTSGIMAEYQAIDGIPPINDGYNPATWVLEVTTPAAELQIGKDFAHVYHDSELFL